MEKPKRELFENGVYSYHYYDAEEMDAHLAELLEPLQSIYIAYKNYDSRGMMFSESSWNAIKNLAERMGW